MFLQNNPYINSLNSYLTMTFEKALKTNDWSTYYARLKNYYDANSLYRPQRASDTMISSWDEAIVGLRNCANRTVEFYVTKVEPGTLPNALPILTENEVIVDAIHQVWQWSNLGQKKSQVIRDYALYGDVFIKTEVNAERTRVRQQYYGPQYVSGFAEDDYGNITYIRLDVPNGKTTHTEIWDMEGYRVYEHKGGFGSDLRMMGDPLDTATLAQMGISFVPFAHAKFRDVGEDRGVGCFVHALDKMDEANRMATRLHQILFQYNKPLWVVSANQTGSDGTFNAPPLPGGELTLKDNNVLTMPGMSTIHSLIPDIKYAEALAILDAMMKELERDLPELGYANLKDKGIISGRAVRLLMADAIDKVVEARANLESALIKSDKHALTLGMVNGIFSGLGSYDAGDFEHSFVERQVVELDDLDRASTLQALVGAGVPVLTAMGLAGYSDESILTAQQEIASTANQRAEQLGTALNAFNQV